MLPVDPHLTGIGRNASAAPEDLILVAIPLREDRNQRPSDASILSLRDSDEVANRRDPNRSGVHILIDLS